MHNVLIGIDNAQIVALDEMAKKYRISRTSLMRDLIYTGIWNEYRGQPGVFRPAPKVGAHGQYVQRCKMVQVDAHGLSTATGELEQLNAPMGEPIAIHPSRVARSSVPAAAYRVFHPMGGISANGHRRPMRCFMGWRRIGLQLQG